MNKKVLVIILLAAILVISGLVIAGYFTFKHFYKNVSEERKTDTNDQSTKPTSSQANYPYTLIAYTGEVFGAKVPQGWTVTSNESGVDIMDPNDNNTGASGAVAVGWFGYQTPDGFIDFMLNAIGATAVSYENESSQETITDPISGLKWVMKTKTFTFNNKNGVKIKAKASAGVLNGYGQFMGMITAFQTTPDKWSKWAPTLERIAKSITIINPSKAGGIDKVKLPTAADLANDSSPIMESWEYRNRVQDRTSHEFSDAIMGQETDLVSPATGQSYTRPLSSYDPTIGGYRNPDNSSEILVDPYAK
ncbi:MAG TPA: hypothetical protein VJJ80_03195 [Patescibacteria group bacterium]|nr:hypothetical protein [Patescibacteria group bacterium]